MKHFIPKWVSEWFCIHSTMMIYPLPHHLVVKTNLKEYDFKYRLIQYWKNVGLSDVERYNSSLGFSHYITKHIGKTEINSWDFLSNFNP